jgi:hypothetical protein
MLSEEQLAVLEDAVADIDEMGDAERYAWRQTARLLVDYRELLAEVEELRGGGQWSRALLKERLDAAEKRAEVLAAEVGRLKPLAEVGEAVGRGIEIEPGDHCLRALSITHQREGAMGGAYRVFGYRVGNSGRIDPAGKRSGDGATLEAALRAAGLMEVNGGAV